MRAVYERSVSTQTSPATHLFYHRSNKYIWTHTLTGISLGMRPAIKRRRYNVTTSLIGWAQTYTDPCDWFRFFGQNYMAILMLCSRYAFTFFKLNSRSYFIGMIPSIQPSERYLQNTLRYAVWSSGFDRLIDRVTWPRLGINAPLESSAGRELVISVTVCSD